MASGIQRIGVLGAGQMGGGIAQVAAQAGFDVLLSDISQAAADRGKTKVTSQLKKLVEKAKLSESEAAASGGRIRAVSGIPALKDCALVVEAVSENPELKFQIFRQLDEVCSPESILASNTSSI